MYDHIVQYTKTYFSLFLALLKIEYTRLPGTVPQPIGLFLFCIEFGWGLTKQIIVLCINLLVGVEIKLHT